MVLKAWTGKKDKAATMKITAKVTALNVTESVFNNGNLSYDRDETAQNEDNTARVIPEPGIIGQSLEPGTVIGGA